jgi:hypothetical protein
MKRVRLKTMIRVQLDIFDQQGKPDLPLDRVVDPTFVKEVLRERR